jgi:hypothetical protein
MKRDAGGSILRFRSFACAFFIVAALKTKFGSEKATRFDLHLNEHRSPHPAFRLSPSPAFVKATSDNQSVLFIHFKRK